MAGALDTRLAELLTARLCHELAGPIAAIGNGAELLAEEGAGFFDEAVRLIGDSAARVARRLQFYRFAYGFLSGGAAAGPPPHELASGLFAGTRVVCDYGEAARSLPFAEQKLACALLPVAAEALPRGGRLAVAFGAAGPTIEAVGEGARLAEDTRAALALETPLEALTSRTVQPYFAALAAAGGGRRIVTDEDVPGRIMFITAKDAPSYAAATGSSTGSRST